MRYCFEHHQFSTLAISDIFKNYIKQKLIQFNNVCRLIGLNCDGEMFFRTTGKALQSLITRHPDEKSDSVEVAREALRRASILGEPIKIHQRLTRYKNKHLVRVLLEIIDYYVLIFIHHVTGKPTSFRKRG